MLPAGTAVPALACLALRSTASEISQLFAMHNSDVWGTRCLQELLCLLGPAQLCAPPAAEVELQGAGCIHAVGHQAGCRHFCRGLLQRSSCCNLGRWAHMAAQKLACNWHA
jgi:hypothetical protein